jgi:hypothetical protein
MKWYLSGQISPITPSRDDAKGDISPNTPTPLDSYIQPAPPVQWSLNVHMEVDNQVDNDRSLTESLIDRKSYHLVDLGGLINIYLDGFKWIRMGWYGFWYIWLVDSCDNKVW